MSTTLIHPPATGCWEISDTSFSRIKLQVGLEHLDVAVSSIGNAGLQAIKAACKQLKYLNLEGNPTDNDAFLTHARTQLASER
jgi:hypothetical protein